LDVNLHISGWQPKDPLFGAPPSNDSSPHKQHLLHEAYYTLGFIPNYTTRTTTNFSSVDGNEMPPATPDPLVNTHLPRSILDSIDIGICTVGLNNKFTYMNAACREFLQSRGLWGDDLAALTDLTMRGSKTYDSTFARELPAHEWPQFRAARGEVVAEHLLGFEVAATGERSVVRISAMPIRDATGNLLGGVARFWDVTDREHAVGREIAAKGEQYFQLVCDSIPQCVGCRHAAFGPELLIVTLRRLVWTARPDGYHDYFNQTWWKFTGAQAEGSMGVGWRSVFHPEDMAEVNK
jgi:PAS domain-containing protein